MESPLTSTNWTEDNERVLKELRLMREEANTRISELDNKIKCIEEEKALSLVFNKKHVLLKAAFADELTYCFDPTYCDDETWLNDHDGQTREQGYVETVRALSEMTFEALMRYYGDKYDYLFDNKEKS